MTTLVIRSCRDCPFHSGDPWSGRCKLTGASTIPTYRPMTALGAYVLPGCPLRDAPVTVRLETP